MSTQQSSPSWRTHLPSLLGCAVVAATGAHVTHLHRTRRQARQDHAHLAAVAHDLRARVRALEAELAWQAEHDVATGLHSDSWFVQAVRDAAGDGEGRAAVLRVGIDGLQSINDAHEPAVSTAVQRTLAERIAAACTGPWSTDVARIGVDEFGVLLREDGSALGRREIDRICRTVLSAVRAPLALGDGTAHLTASIGAARDADGHSSDGGVLLHRAAVALHAARTRGVEQVETFDTKDHVELADRLSLGADLRSAVVTQAFELDFQPIVDLHDGRVVTVEALVRWNHPELGRINPDRFIPEAERTGHMPQIGRFALEEAAWRARAWHREHGDRAPSVAVNVSTRQLDDRLVEIVEEVLDDTLLSPGSLTLELTETAVVAGGSQLLRRRLHELKELGVTLALDDFGTGYSSLDYLGNLPFDVLKIDRSFVATAVARPAVVSTIIDLARKVGLLTVIEGIETVEQRDRFRELGCDRAQGFLFGPPAPTLDLPAGGLSTRV